MMARWLRRVCIAMSCAAMLVVSVGCVGPQTETRGDGSDQEAAQKLDLDRPVSGKVFADGKRQRYLVKVPRAGKLTVKLSWNNPYAMEKLIVQSGSKQVETRDLRDTLQANHETEAIAGFYYVEIIPGTEVDSYNLVVTLE